MYLGLFTMISVLYCIGTLNVALLFFLIKNNYLKKNILVKKLFVLSVSL
jgi:hypothetical protein